MARAGGELNEQATAVSSRHSSSPRPANVVVQPQYRGSRGLEKQTWPVIMNGIKRQSSSSDAVVNNPLASSGMSAWYEALKKSYTRNYVYSEEPVFVHMSNIKRSGDVSMHSLHFQDFLEDDCRFLEFLLAMNDNLLMGDIKSDPNAKLCWSMPKTKEHFYLHGKFYIASAPIQVTRFPAPKVVNNDILAADYWEAERLKQWQKLDAPTRAMFTWPPRRETPKAAKIAFSCTSLEDMTSNSTARKPGSVQVAHDIAMDNFCLLIFKISAVEHFQYNSFPPQRNMYTIQGGDCTASEANP